MLRLIVIAAVVSIGCRMIFGKWPWDYLRMRAARGQAVARARRLLGVCENADHGEIIAAHKRLVAVVHPDRGGTAAQVHEANAARDLLLDHLPRRGLDQS
ncbi:J domain-containing protein [Pelagerythrobacter marinus]|uniref:J domain-containing protein n=1 Tax=Pelagerythrobacter marinus TaxID=538382 RepID=UPI0020372869|nr:J domain-containing protein [Pelagerythrobacter marinus]USA39068.1 J domain-containing protein [Pelagerythrobacter marinus]WPZ06846.1 J domain-containing protein [Pelagerythrobacter marinus]